MVELMLLRVRLLRLIVLVRLMGHLGQRPRLTTGRGFFFLTSILERRCAVQTDLLLRGAGNKAPQCFEELGTVLSLLDRLSSCFWGCRGGDHLPEYLVGRAIGNLRSAVQLLRLGYYDESLSLSRNAGEVANLLALFERDSPALADWRALSGPERWGKYRPARVRTMLEAHGGPLISTDRYSRLSEIGTHATPSTRPQAHNPLGIQT